MIIYILFLNVLKYAMWTPQTTRHTLPRSVMRVHSAEITTRRAWRLEVENHRNGNRDPGAKGRAEES